MPCSEHEGSDAPDRPTRMRSGNITYRCNARTELRAGKRWCGKASTVNARHQVTLGILASLGVDEQPDHKGRYRTTQSPMYPVYMDNYVPDPTWGEMLQNLTESETPENKGDIA